MDKATDAKIEPKVKAGKLFCFATGEYSDYGIQGHYLALVDITQELFDQAKGGALARIKSGEYKRWGKQIDMEDEWEVSDAMFSLFVPELVRLGAIMDIDCAEIHIGSYGRLEV